MLQENWRKKYIWFGTRVTKKKFEVLQNRKSSWNAWTVIGRMKADNKDGRKLHRTAGNFMAETERWWSETLILQADMYML